MTVSITVRNFVKNYGNTRAVDDVSFEAFHGEVFSLLGPNGAGKSTIVRALVGLHAPDGGSVTIEGFDMAAEPVRARERIGYLPEVAQLYESLTAREYLTMVARLHRMDAGRAARSMDSVLEILDLHKFADAPIATFSKGMKQKTALTAALLPNPRVLILDEPMSGLDAEAALVVRALVREFAASGRTVLYTSHLLDVVEKVADRVAILVKGRLAAIGTLDHVRSLAGTRGDLSEVFASLVRSEDPVERARRALGAIDP